METLQAKCDKYCLEASGRNSALRRGGAVYTGGTVVCDKTKDSCKGISCAIPVSPCSGGKLVADGDYRSKWQCP